jgi:Acyl-CoA dehydrogenase, C-terminal domain
VAASSHPLAPAALGAAEGAYELFVSSMSKRAGTYTGAKVADFQVVQIKLARARCLVDSARLLLRESAIAFHAMAERNEVPDLQTKLRYRAHSAFAVNQAREALETLWSCMARRASTRAIRCSATCAMFSPSASISPSISTLRARRMGWRRSAGTIQIRQCDAPKSHFVKRENLDLDRRRREHSATHGSD